MTITDRNQKSSVTSLQKQFDLVQNDKLAHLLHLAKYDENFTKFGDSYKNLYYHTSTAKGRIIEKSELSKFSEYVTMFMVVYFKHMACLQSSRGFYVLMFL